MQITSNTVGCPSAVFSTIDKDGNDLCAVVGKVTFDVDLQGESSVALAQQPVTLVDTYSGEPGFSSIRYESDCAAFKPKADVIVNGSACSPNGRAVESMEVHLEIGRLRKTIRVTGQRYWRRGLFGLLPSAPEPFTEMPLIYERAFGGSDHTHTDPKFHGTYESNHVGVGFRSNPDASCLLDAPLPNLENPRFLIQNTEDKALSVGFGSLCRNWQPRVAYAGTYGKEWLKNRFPFVPEDFDHRFHLSSPADQQFGSLIPHEVVRCINMTTDGLFAFSIPEIVIPVLFRCDTRDETRHAKPDTLLVEPSTRQFSLVWRTTVVLGRKPNSIREIMIGPQPRWRTDARSAEKPHFESTAAYLVWKKELLDW